MALLRRIEKHLRRSGMPPTLFGRAAVGDPRFVHDLRRGRVPRPSTVARVAAWLDSHAEEPREAADQLKQVAGVHFVHFAGAIEVEVDSRSWASALFVGAQHRLTLHLRGLDADAAADEFLEGLGERDFALVGHVLADIVAVRRERDSRGESVRLTLEALTLETA